MNKSIILAILVCLILTGCAGSGFNKKATLMPDELWFTGDTNLEEEDNSEIGFGIKWKFK